MHGLSLAGGKGGEKRYDPDHAVVAVEDRPVPR